MGTPVSTAADAGGRFRRTLIRVMSVQVLTLVLLGVTQWWFSR